MAFVPEMSTDSICVGADTTLCLSDKLDAMDAAIAAGQGGGAVEPMAVAAMHLGKLDNNNGAELASSNRICSDPIAIQNGKTYWQVNTKGVNMYVLLYDANEMFVQFAGNVPSGQAIPIQNPEAAYLRLCSLVGEYDLNNEFHIYDQDPAGGGSGEVVDAYTKAESDARFAPLNHTHDGYAAAEVLAAHTGSTGNPHGVTKDQVGLGNVDNTSDAAKPVSAAVQAALDGKAAAGDLSSHVASKSNPHGVTAAQAGAVPAGRKVNGKALSADISLTAADVGARPSTWVPSAAEVGATFDKVIRTQAEFNALIGSADWLGAKSVCFVGNGGSLKFTRTGGQGIKIPQTVRQIQGMNQAIIEVTGFAYDKTANLAALFYSTLPATDEYTIRDLTVSCAGTGGSKSSSNITGFARCRNLINCTGIGKCTGTGIANWIRGYGFFECKNLENCTGTGTCTSTGDELAYGEGFCDCTNLTHCVGTGTGTVSGTGDAFGYGFDGCQYLANCTGTGTARNESDNSGRSAGFYACDYVTNCTGIGNGSGYTYGFSGCDNLTNCSGTGAGNYGNSAGGGFFGCHQLANCQGIASSVGTGKAVGFDNCGYLANCRGSGMSKDSDNGYCFNNCSYLNGCATVSPGYTTAFFIGNNTYVDTLTVRQ